MTAQELLPILRKMLSDYEFETFEYMELDENLTRGFCNYLFRKAFPSVDYNEILKELYKDYEPIIQTWTVKDNNYLEHYWYPTFKNVSDYELSIKPRIANLKRTIARLEQSI